MGLRARIALGALILTSVPVMLWLGSGVGANTKVFLRGNQDRVWVHMDAQPFNDNRSAAKATHLIIVAGHSVLISGDVENAATDESVWWLLDYQKNHGLPQSILGHIQAGIQLAMEDPDSLLVFSGGQTRGQTGPESEGSSYYRVADALHLWDGRKAFPPSSIRRQANQQSTVRARTTTEEFALDSFQNLLFSICRFHEVTGSYPDRVSMISFTFKQERFETLHAQALLLPEFVFVGVDPPPSTGFDLKQSSEGERINSLLPFRIDPYGCHSEVLQRKRKERNPFSRTPPYELTCPEMKDLLKWCGPEIIEKSKVPWH